MDVYKLTNYHVDKERIARCRNPLQEMVASAKGNDEFIEATMLQEQLLKFMISAINDFGCYSDLGKTYEHLSDEE